MGIFVYTSAGRLAEATQITQPGDGVDLDVSKLQTGLYYLCLVDADGERQTLSFIKQ